MVGYTCVCEDGKPFDPKYLCSSCTCVLRDPVQTKCGHRYCRACVDELLTRAPSSRCFICNEEMKRQQIFEDLFARREILSLPVQCTNHLDGCDWRGELRQLEDHEARCLFTKVQCMHPSCGVLVPRDDLTRHLTEDCSFRELQCELCGLMTTADKLKEHKENDCQECIVDCPKCLTVKLSRKMLSRHIEEDCEAVVVPCPFHDIGCPDGKPKKQRENRDHQEKEAARHLNLLLLFVKQLSSLVYSDLDSVNAFKGNSEFMQNLDKTIQSLLHKVETMLNDHSCLASVVQGHGTRISNLEKSIEHVLMDDVVPDCAPLNSLHRSSGADISRVLRRLEDHDAKVANHEVLLVELNTFLQGQNQEMNRLETQVRNANDEIRKLQRRMESLEHTLSLRNIVTADLEEYVKQKEFSSYDGVLIWKITDFNRRRNEAITGRQVSIYSPCFYTSRHGYKMCVRIYLNGDGTGKGTHISLFFVVMRGEYDALLRWPFRQKVTFMLLDQNNVEHVIDAFRPDPSSSSFQRPRRESNIASGCPTFCPLSELNNHSYVQDDTMFIKVIVDTADI